MKITSSYKAEIIGMKNIFLPTVKAYQAALRYLIGVYDAEWEFIQCLNGTKRRFNRAERLVHGTKGNKELGIRRLQGSKTEAAMQPEQHACFLPGRYVQGNGKSLCC